MNEIQKPATSIETEYNQRGENPAQACPTDRLRVEVPAEPPQLSPHAARALLHLLIRARPRPVTAHRQEET